MKELLFVLLMVSSMHCSPAPEPIIHTKAELDERLETIASYQRIAGFSVSIFNRDSVLYQNAFGYSDREAAASYVIETSQIIASVSKTLIAVALMKCQEEGLIALDDPINDHLPFQIKNPHFPREEITIRQLAMHTSSIRYSELMTDSLGYAHADRSIGDMMRSYLTPDGEWYDPSNFHNKKPGQLGDYTNVGATLAAYIVEYRSGLSFDEFVRIHIVDPLEMESTSYLDSMYVSTGHYEYLVQDGFKRIEPRQDALYPNGSLVTNVSDLTRFCQMVMNEGSLHDISILNPSSVKEMLSVYKLKSLDDDISRQGIFWSTMKSPLGIPVEMIGHNGGDTGVYTMMYVDQEKGIGYILLSNTGLTEENHISYVGIYKSLWRYALSL